MSRQIDFIVLHCTASSQTQTVQEIINYWKNVKKWSQKGYHFLIEPNGTAHNLVPIDQVSNGVAGHNANSIHISYIGGVSTKANEPELNAGTPIDNRTPAQKVTQEALVRKYHQMFPKAVIQGHRDFSPDKNRDGLISPNEWIKACPSFEVKDWLREIGLKSGLPKDYYLTSVDNLNIREGQGVEFKPVSSPLPKDTLVKKVAEVPGWSFVEWKGTDIVGWVATRYLWTDNPPAKW